MPVWTLNADDTPVPIVPGALLDPADLTPTTASQLAQNDTHQLRTKFNNNATRLDVTGRYGGGGYAIVYGLDLTDGGGLTLNISAGQAMIDGPVTKDAAFTAALTNNTARIYLYLSQAGAVVQVNNSLTPPAGAHAFLGSAVTSGGAITQIDASGVMYLRGSILWRRTADATTPTDTPPATLAYYVHGPADLWFWDGISYYQLTSSSGSPLPITEGGTGASTAGGARTNLAVCRRDGYALLFADDADELEYADTIDDWDFAVIDTDTVTGGAYTIRLPDGAAIPPITGGRNWIVHNADTTHTVTIRGDGEGGPGVSIPPLHSAVVYVSLGLETRFATPPVSILGIVPVAYGGTGATSAGAARTALGLGTIATVNSPVPIANGGTAGTDAVTARVNLGAQNAPARLQVTLSSTTLTLSAAQMRAEVLEFIGSPGGAATVTTDTTYGSGDYLFVWNNTTGGFAITFKHPSGGANPGVTVANGMRAIIYNDNNGNEVRALAGSAWTDYTSNYATLDRTLDNYTTDAESAAYTGAADGEAKLVDLNALRVAYENLRASHDDLLAFVNAMATDLIGCAVFR